MPENSENAWLIKGRYLFLILFIVIVITLLFREIVLPLFIIDVETHLATVITSMFFYLLLTFILYITAVKASVNINLLLGSFKKEYLGTKYIFAAIPLAGLSAVGVYLLYYPLSFVVPEYVKGAIINDASDNFWLTGDNLLLANTLSFINIAVLIPFSEELFFRAFLITGLGRKWSAAKAVTAAVIIYGVANGNPVGAAFEAAVFSIFYLRTRSLAVPVILHSLLNILDYANTWFAKTTGYTVYATLDTFRSSLWYPLAGLAVSLPWLIYFYNKERAEGKLVVPYFRKNNIDIVKEGKDDY
jgi:membrane protease YdiL (CAAX protease family)